MVPERGIEPRTSSLRVTRRGYIPNLIKLYNPIYFIVFQWLILYSAIIKFYENSRFCISSPTHSLNVSGIKVSDTLWLRC